MFLLARTQSNCIWLIRRRSVLGFVTSKTVGAQTSERIYVHFIFMPLGFCVSFLPPLFQTHTHTPVFFILFLFFPQFLHFSSNLIQKSEPVIDHLSFCRRVSDTVKKNPPASPRRSFVKNVFQVTQSNKNYASRQELFSLFIPFYAWNKFLIF